VIRSIEAAGPDDREVVEILVREAAEAVMRTRLRPSGAPEIVDDINEALGTIDDATWFANLYGVPVASEFNFFLWAVFVEWGASLVEMGMGQ
jgi:hypothetical protein